MQQICFDQGMNFYVETHIDRITEDVVGFERIMDACPTYFEVNAVSTHTHTHTTRARARTLRCKFNSGDCCLTNCAWAGNRISATMCTAGLRRVPRWGKSLRGWATRISGWLASTATCQVRQRKSTPAFECWKMANRLLVLIADVADPEKDWADKGLTYQAFEAMKPVFVSTQAQ